MDAVASGFRECAVGDLKHADRARGRPVHLEGIPAEPPPPIGPRQRLAAALYPGQGGQQFRRDDRSFRSICACHMYSPIVVSTRHVDAPWIAADLAVLNEAAVDVRLDVDLQLLAAKRTRDQELVRH
jgi:hypothetical protein